MKLALVTGAGVRLGRAIALRLARDGHRLALHYHSSAGAAEETRRAILDQGGEAWLFQADLSQISEPARLAAAVQQQLGPVAILINSAAHFFPTSSLSESAARWDELFALNVRAPLGLVCALEENLRAERGCVVNLVDIYALRPLPEHLTYCISKSALWSLTQNLALQLAPDVRVNAVAPGAALPPAGGFAGPDQLERLKAPIPLQRLGGAEEISEAVAYLCAAQFVTGQMLCVDGGRTLNL